MPKRKYNPSPETLQAEREARAAGFIRAAEACEVLDLRTQHLAAYCYHWKIDGRNVGREIWYSSAGISSVIGARLAHDRAAMQLLKRYARKR